MKIGDMVRYSQSFKKMSESAKKDITGVVIGVEGKKWAKIHWIDGIVYSEHVDDLEIAKKEYKN